MVKFIFYHYNQPPLSVMKYPTGNHFVLPQRDDNVTVEGTDYRVDHIGIDYVDSDYTEVYIQITPMKV